MKPDESTFELLPYWIRLSNEEKDLVRATGVVRRYAKGEFIHGGETDCLGQILLLSGEVRAYLLSEEGREITLFILRSGETCVLSASCVLNAVTFDTQLAAKQESDLLIVQSATFKRLVDQNIYVRCAMYERMTERFSQVMWTMQEILFKGFDRRLATFLVSECDRTGSRYIQMTHEQIAECVSSAREVVARMLKRFAADGLVELGRGTVKLVDVGALRRLS